MPAKYTQTTNKLEKSLKELGQRLRDRRRQLKLSSVVTSEAAGMSRMTLYRVEQGEASVAMAAYLSVIQALGLNLKLEDSNFSKTKKSVELTQLPKKIKVTDYKQLKKLAWQLKDTTQLNPQDAFDLYERNWRHIDHNSMDEKERRLLELLLASFGRERLLV